MRKTLAAAAAAVIAGFSSLALAGTPLSVAATPVPHADILKLIEPDLKAAGYDLKVVEFSDYVSPNLALDAGEVDANYYQHLPFLNASVAARKLKVVPVKPIHILPMAAYSKKVKNVARLRKGATVTIPNDPSNGGRALLLLEDAGLIKLRPNVGVKATVLDIVSNPRKLRIREVEAAQVPRTLDDVDLAVVNSNYAIGVGLNQVKDSIYLESKTSPYAVVVATLKGHEADAKVQALVKALTSAKVRKFMIEQYKGSVVPVF
jgi:D-methionine transport system substrate-binding protein